ncbi:hypothetical protein ACHAXN_007960 [Cyclotella atomus]
MSTSTSTTHLLLRRQSSSPPDSEDPISNDITDSQHHPLLPPLPPQSTLSVTTSTTASLPTPPSVVRQRSDSIPRLLENQLGPPIVPSVPHIQDTQDYNVQAPPSHKRKQSDIPSHNDLLPVSPSALFRSSLNLEIHDEEDDDSIVYSGPVDENVYNSGRWKYYNTVEVGKLKIKWLGISIMVLLALYSTTRHTSTSKDSYNDADGYESVGDPMESSVKYNSIEYYSDLNRLGHLTSFGPTPVTYQGSGTTTAVPGGMYTYENVCVTNNVDYPKKPYEDTSMRGLIRFTNDATLLKNPKRCVPCTADETEELQSTAVGTIDSSVKHPCGMKGLHEMYASTLIDWKECINNKDNHGLMIRTKQSQSPSQVTNVHFFDRPTFLLQFTANNRESSLFDTLFSYLPHWHHYRSTDYPFDGILSHSVEGCLSHSRNWLCEILHHMSAFGSAKEIIWEESPKTLYCFRELHVNRMGYQRSLSNGQISKPILDEVRDVLFRSMALPRPRDMNEIRKKDAKLGISRPFRIVLYSNSHHSTNVWSNMDELVIEARGNNKYHGVEFTVEDDLDELTVAEQAKVFNLADAVIMSTGEHWGNVIFVTEDTVFVELGCGGFSNVENRHFMGLILGSHRSVRECRGGGEEDYCVQCTREGLNSSFRIEEDAFHGVVDEILKSHRDKVAIMRDS